MFSTEKDLREYLIQPPSSRRKKKRRKNDLHQLQVKTARRQEVTGSSRKSMASVVESMDLNPALLVTIRMIPHM